MLFFTVCLTFIYWSSLFYSSSYKTRASLYLNNLLKNMSLISALVFFGFNAIFFFSSLNLSYISNTNIFSLSYTFLQPFYLFTFYNFSFTFNFFGFLLFFLAFLVGLISLAALDTRIVLNKTTFFFFFNYFLVFVFLFVTTNNLILFFIFYELFLLPSFLFVYYISYTKKAIQASIYFVIWTQVGSLLVLIAVGLIYVIVGNSDFFIIKSFFFKNWEAYTIFSLIFFGFGIKVPIWPFHYWLTKTHVEAPSGFSIYLSGFLVKSALFGFYKVASSIIYEIDTTLFCAMAFVGAIDASLKMWGQSDLKKLVAYCTIQEMNLIFFLFLLGDSSANIIGALFTITHAFLSILMFFLVDCIYRRYHSRSIFVVQGILTSAPNLGTAIIFMIIFFSGLPGTLKFICEFYIFSLLLQHSWIFTCFFILCLNFLGLIGFSKPWFNSIFLFNDTKAKTFFLDLSRKELLIILFCFFCLTFFTYCNIFFI